MQVGHVRCVCNFALAVGVAFAAAACDRMITPRNAQLLKDADAKTAGGDYARAINFYEAALDDSESVRNAEIHYKLALLYDDKLNDPVNALHHFKRYLALAPNGTRANDVRNFIKRDEVSLATSLSGDLVVTRGEATRLRNENLTLRRELEQTGSKTSPDKTALQDRHAEKTGAGSAAAKTYTVRPGDTLASISRKFYRSSKRWKDILDANRKNIDNPEKLRVGQTLSIP